MATEMNVGPSPRALMRLTGPTNVRLSLTIALVPMREEWISMRDAQGYELSGATTEAVGYFDRAVRAFALIYGDASGLYDAALKASPEFVMAYLGKAWPLSLANDPLMAASAQ